MGWLTREPVVSIQPIQDAISIVGLGALSALGCDVAAHHAAVASKTVPFRPLAVLLGQDSQHAHRPGAWIEDRSLLLHRKWSPATMAALHVARQAIHESGWSASELSDAALVLGTSRGNAAGWLGPWPGRRPFKLMAASNTIHSEPASAITIEFQIHGPNHVVASGCSAGLDAVGLAMMMLQSGLAKRALAVAVDLPLVPLLLDNYASSGILTRQFSLDPYAPDTSGFVPGEGAAAIAMELTPDGVPHPKLRAYRCNSDASDPVGIPKDGGRTPELFAQIPETTARIAALCPHATGTAVQAAADPATMERANPNRDWSLHLLKPLLGHTIGASGLLESTILAAYLRQCCFPPNLAGLHVPDGRSAPQSPTPASGWIAKLSHGMGGHNALLVMSPS